MPRIQYFGRKIRLSRDEVWVLFKNEQPVEFLGYPVPSYDWCCRKLKLLPNTLNSWIILLDINNSKFDIYAFCH